MYKRQFRAPPRRSHHDLSSLRFAVTGAATVPVALIERMQSELEIDIVLTAYGLTEAARWLLYTSDAADERSRVDSGGPRIIKKKKKKQKK